LPIQNSQNCIQFLMSSKACHCKCNLSEIANALLVGERRKVITEAQVIDYLERLSHLPIMTDDATPASRRDSVMSLAREYGLTAYDATYLELALRTNSVLATFDSQLIDAMHQVGGKIFGEK
jgi:predicted nucleic acid-binding protein